MELREFIKNTLTAIQGGVEDAIKATSGSGMTGVINPSWGGHKGINGGLIEKVHFDIAVTATDKTSLGGEAGIKVIGIKLGGEGSSFNESSNASRIQFAIPIIPPVTTVNPVEE